MKASSTLRNRQSIALLLLCLIPLVSASMAGGQSVPRHDLSNRQRDNGSLPLGRMLLADRVLISSPGEWEYLDNGLVPHALWYQQASDDDRWKPGASPFGYGNDGERTRVGFGPDPADKAITAYFRRRFTVTDTTGYRTLELRLRRDDGAVVYLNGAELLRSNMPAGTVGRQTRALSYIEWEEEQVEGVYHIPVSRLVIGENRIGVEIHQNSPLSTDLAFDLTLTLREAYFPPTQLGSGSIVTCDPAASNRIGCFTSVVPTDQIEQLVLPRTHTFQRLVKSDRDRYTGTNTVVPNGNDFTAYLGDDGSSVQGRLSINHENTPGGVSVANIHFDRRSGLWKIDALNAVDFSSVVKTERNCSGGVTPWGTIITSEETYSTGDENGDGYEDIGWQVELDPVTRKVRDYDGDGRPDKLWALGRLVHENIAFSADGRTVYQAEDGGTGCIYKFVAAQAGRLDSGTLYVLHRDTDSSTTGYWIQVPNSTKSERNNVSTVAAAIGGSFIGSIEDVEVGPDGKIYFASKNVGEIGRFRDNGTTVSEIEAWVSNVVYPIATDTGVVGERWNRGNDNLAFDSEGNLWVLEDGGRYHIWVVRADHSRANPHIDVFATTPYGGEPTGITFSPDFRFLFMSFQNPSIANTTGQRDAADSLVVFDASTTIVIARKEHLGRGSVAPAVDLGNDILICESSGPVELKYVNHDAFHIWSDGSTDSVLRITRDGLYHITVTGNNGIVSRDTVSVRFLASTPLDLGGDRILCPGTTHTFVAPPGLTYLWENGSTLQERTIDRPGIYHLMILDGNSCPSYDTVAITYATAPEPQLGDDRVICDGASITLDPGAGFASYLWNDGSATQRREVAAPGTYSVRVTSAEGCVAYDTIVVRDVTNPRLGDDLVLCAGESARISPGDSFATYLWSDGSTSPSMTVASSGTYWVQVTGEGGCSGIDTLRVTVNDPIEIDLGADTSICATCSITLDAGAGFESYLWSTGATTRTILVRDSGRYTLSVTDSDGCVADDSIFVSVEEITGVGELISNNRFSLSAWPNPFQSEITIGITMRKRSDLRLEVYDPSGRKVATLLDGPLDSGEHTFRFDAGQLAGSDGVYLLRVTVDGATSNHKLVRK